MVFKKLLKDYWLLFLIAGVIIIVDQVSKAYIRTHFAEGVDVWAPWPWLLPYARIINVGNTGVAFGMFQGMGSVFAILAIIVSIAIIYYFPRVPATDWTLRVAMGLQLAGAVGNLIDRIIQGHVTDFISVGNFPVFNVADSSITIGVGVLLLGIWLQERRQKREQELADRVSQATDSIDSDTPSRDSHAG